MLNVATNERPTEMISEGFASAVLVPATALEPMKRSRLRPVSKKRARRVATERRVRDDYLHLHPYCEAAEAGAPGQCFGMLHVHEVLTRARGGSTDDPANLRSVCDFHNDMISQDVDTMRWAYSNDFLRRAT